MPMYKKSLLILLILALAAAGGTIYGIYSQNQSETLDSAEQDTEAVSRTITVYVTGAVNKPGVVTVAEGDTGVPGAADGAWTAGAQPTAPSAVASAPAPSARRVITRSRRHRRRSRRLR